MGIYDAVIGQLKPLPVQDEGKQQKVDAQKAEIRGAYALLTPSDLGLLYIEARKAKQTIATQLSTADTRVAAIEQLLADSLRNGETGWGTHGASPTTVRLESGDSISIQREPSAKVEDKEAFRKWCIANGYEGQLTLPSPTVSSIVKERLLSGEAEPDGVSAYVYNKVVWR